MGKSFRTHHSQRKVDMEIRLMRFTLWRCLYKVSARAESLKKTKSKLLTSTKNRLQYCCTSAETYCNCPGPTLLLLSTHSHLSSYLFDSMVNFLGHCTSLAVLLDLCCSISLGSAIPQINIVSKMQGSSLSNSASL